MDIQLIIPTDTLDLTNSSVFAKLGQKLSHKPEVIIEQVKSGLYTLKRFAGLVKSSTDAQKIYAKSLLDAAELVIDRKDKLALDLMKKHSSCCKQLNTYLANTGQAQLKAVEQIFTQVVDPLLVYYKEADSQLKKLIDEEKAIKDVTAALHANVQKEKEEYLKVVNAYQELASSHSGKAPKALGKAHSAYAKYEEVVKNANKEKDEVINKRTLILVTHLERLEVGRLRATENHLRTYSELRNQLDNLSKNELNNVKALLNSTSIDEDVDNFIQSSILIYGTSASKSFSLSDLPSLPPLPSNEGGE